MTNITKLYCKKCNKQTDHEFEAEIIKDGESSFTMIAKCTRCGTKQKLNNVKLWQ